jgi:hypothetical protein
LSTEEDLLIIKNRDKINDSNVNVENANEYKKFHPMGKQIMKFIKEKECLKLHV